MKRALLAAAIGLLIATASAGAGPNLVVGTTESAVLGADAPTVAAQFGLVTSLGMKAVRINAAWSPGQTAPDPSLLPAYTATAQQAALLGIRVYLEVYPQPPAVPADATARGQFQQYLQSLALALPQVHDFIIGTQVNNPLFWPQDAKAIASYAALLGDSYDALKSISPSLQVIGASLDAQHTPGTWILSLGQAYRKSGRTTPIMDALAIQPQNDNAAQPPGFIHATGPIDIGDYPRLVANLKRAFGTTAQLGATLPIVYDGYGVQTTIPATKSALYTGVENDAVDEPSQGARYAEALQLAACQPNVVALLFQHTVDERDLAGWQSGLFYPDLTPKTDLETVRTAIAASTAASCGQTATPPPTSPQTPTPAPTPAKLDLTIEGAAATLTCDRACYYVAVLENAAGAPVQARQGTIGAAGTAQVTVAKAKLPPGSYHLTVHAAPRVNPSEGIARDGAPFDLP